MPGVLTKHAINFSKQKLTCIPIFEIADLVIPLVSMGTTMRDLFWWGFPSLVFAKRHAQSAWLVEVKL